MLCVVGLLCGFVLPSIALASPEESSKAETDKSQVTEAVTCVICDGSSHTTITITGSGGTCADAQTYLSNQLKSIADNDCINFQTGSPSCQFQVTTTIACTQVSPGVWQVHGYAKYACRDYIC